MSSTEFYKAYSMVSNAIADGKIAEGKAGYEELINFAKGDCKNLVAPVIPKFAHHFPDQLDKAINALLDLCEDESSSIRMDAIRGFRVLTDHIPESISRVSSLLTQLLILEDDEELKVLHSTFGPIFASDIKQASQAVFHHIKNGSAQLKEKTTQFFAGQVQKCKKAIAADMELQQYLIDLILDVVTEAGNSMTGKDLQNLFRTLTSFEVFRDNKHPSLLRRVKEAVEAIATGEATLDNEEAAKRFRECLIVGGILTSKSVDCMDIPALLFSKLETGYPALGEDTVSELVKICTRANTYSKRMTETHAEKLFPSVYALFGSIAEGKVNLQACECLLFLIHNLGAKKANFAKQMIGLEGVDETDQLAKKAALLGFTASLSKELVLKTSECKEELKDLAKKIMAMKKGEEKQELKKKQSQCKRTLKCATNVETMCDFLKAGKIVSIPVVLSYGGRRAKPTKEAKDAAKKVLGEKRKRGKADAKEAEGIDKLHMSLDDIVKAEKDVVKKQKKIAEAKGRGRGKGNRGGRNGNKSGRGSRQQRSKSQPPKKKKNADAKRNAARGNRENTGRGRGRKSSQQGNQKRGRQQQQQQGQRAGQKRKRNQQQQPQQQNRGQKQRRGGRGRGRGRGRGGRRRRN
mmetsp:Transcript_34958/g.84558  ORF Transcript_34958/g.84558 Transcript_34958/m.84558 type:complete len:634 (+) Transcript_34958:318-2219(+)